MTNESLEVQRRDNAVSQGKEVCVEEATLHVPERAGKFN